MPDQSPRQTRIAIVGNPNSIHDWDMANALAQDPNGFALQYITNHPLEAYSGLLSQIRVHTWLPQTYRPLRAALTGEIRQAVRQFMALHRFAPFDLVLSSYFYPYGLWAWQFARAAGLPHIAVVHGSDLLVDYRLGLLRPAGFPQALTFGQLRHEYRQAMRSATKVLGNSPALLSMAHSLGVAQARTALLRPLVDFDELDTFAGQIKSELSLNHKKKDETHGPRILSPRLVKAIYNTKLQIQALHLLVQQFPSARLTLIDPNPKSDYSHGVRALVERLGLAHAVRILPWQTRIGMVRLYLASDMALLTPSSDGLPVTGLEALYLRCPLVLGTLPWLPHHLRYEASLLGPQHTWHAQAHTPQAIAQALADCWLAHKNAPKSFEAKLEAGHHAAKSLGGKVASVTRLTEYVNYITGRNIKKTFD